MGLTDVLCAGIVLASIFAAAVPLLAMDGASRRAVLANKGSRMILAFAAIVFFLGALAFLVPGPQYGDYFDVATQTTLYP